MTTPTNPYHEDIPSDGPLLGWYLTVCDNAGIYPVDDVELTTLLVGPFTQRLSDPVFGKHLYIARRGGQRLQGSVKVWHQWADWTASTWYTGSTET